MYTVGWTTLKNDSAACRNSHIGCIFCQMLHGFSQLWFRWTLKDPSVMPGQRMSQDVHQLSLYFPLPYFTICCENMLSPQYNLVTLQIHNSWIKIIQGGSSSYNQSVSTMVNELKFETSFHWTYYHPHKSCLNSFNIDIASYALPDANYNSEVKTKNPKIR
jgi:hypothetical protein